MPPAQVDPAEYSDFVKRETSKFEKSRGGESIKYEDFFAH